MVLNEILARNIKRRRAELGKSASALAREAGLSKQTVVSLESGESNPTIDTLDRVAQALEIQPRALMTEMGIDILHNRAEDADWRRNGHAYVRPLDRAFGHGYVMNALVRLEKSRGPAHYPASTRGALRHCFIIRGRVRLGPSHAETIAAPGDFIRFPADAPHTLDPITPEVLMFACTTAPQIAMSDLEVGF